MPAIDDNKLLVGLIGGSIIAYNGVRWFKTYWNSRKAEFVPIGIVKQLYIYPSKSCKGKKVFSFYCGPKGPISGEMRDRFLQVIDGKTGKFYTARQKPQMVLIDVTIQNGEISLALPDGRQAKISTDDVKKRNDVRKTTLHGGLRTDGLDCGQEFSSLLSDFIEEEDVRMVLYVDGLFTERTCIPDQAWWMNNNVPKRIDNVAYSDLAPYMIQTEGSLEELNSRLDENVEQLNFRPVIVIDKCPAWDEDRWSDLRIGDVELQCFKPCTRCILTTVNPATGKKHPEMQPLKELRQFRMAPEGPMRKEFKDSPIFGVNAGVTREGYIHEGQVVYARYKPSEW